MERAISGRAHSAEWSCRRAPSSSFDSQAILSDQPYITPDSGALIVTVEYCPISLEIFDFSGPKR